MKNRTPVEAGNISDLRILIVSPRQCWPTRSGAKLRDYHLAQALGARSQLTYVYYGDRGVVPMTTEQLTFARSVAMVPRPRGYSPAKLLRGLWSRWPLPVVNYYSLSMARALESILKKDPFDVIQFEATQLAALEPVVRKHCPGAQVVFDWHNVESELLQRYTASSISPLRRAYAKITAAKMARLEAQLLRGDAWHLVCSEREQAKLRALEPHSRVAVVRNGVDVEYYACEAQGSQAFPRKNRLLFVGLMSYHANIEAALWFTKEVWPDVRAKFPELTLTLAGADPVASILELKNVPGVEVTGTVPDLRPFYREAFAVVVPLRTGAGTRLKILEAMAAGVPVISTALGAEGLGLSSSTNVLIAESREDWMTHLDLLSGPERRESLIGEARNLIRANYDWRTIGTALFDTYVTWLRDRGEATTSKHSPESRPALPLRPSGRQS